MEKRTRNCFISYHHNNDQEYLADLRKVVRSMKVSDSPNSIAKRTHKPTMKNRNEILEIKEPYRIIEFRESIFYTKIQIKIGNPIID